MLPVKLHVQMDAMHILNSFLAKLNYLGAKSSQKKQLTNDKSDEQLQNRRESHS